ncbi:MAG: hypothetical protein A2700_01035 [Candidatus Blackburnbacteria bacterium RIFCSPHIGHO2_01_FULL_44_64]|uniref:Uncharacterized protein n=1 Tax=Candidatus Blackburnbacteria bacterium RIFCSPHIGHO2_02_FULL_44_20 TaxID=1797516 RepID=A0A1G1V625_9BACT|nr:MAG: hypothetical protein A2700_01035 [Candidatus Blackburnbacteria bacterium RIFCSPHIGHO2_01_FULL_44_64]OGY10807.1 MAG: hypothetical protein A3D26_01465 [Candidatus Blackburnbacteria bacterium RIFCSPHIGHO2_02_FULL_44_20]OGY10842.1 MAG: hypothetical protein A3E16_04095 [Candidatus Blackburnbacteria bacterium RIFCSPHIGHO2_12_FULL_44_25]OGY14787.1 MAG: hypothetical protein A3A62_02180 [Candidatus Blackburnbacteria bacterium RIFCSPLOWO2_01_FULL_44_43]OGY15256.1 MAG: hypothetical protein A3H88_0
MGLVMLEAGGMFLLTAVADWERAVRFSPLVGAGDPVALVFHENPNLLRHGEMKEGLTLFGRNARPLGGLYDAELVGALILVRPVGSFPGSSGQRLLRFATILEAIAMCSREMLLVQKDNSP